MRRGWRIACVAIVVALCTAQAFSGECKPQRVTGKGVTYAIDLPTGENGQIETLVLDPGRDAFLTAASTNRELPCVRTGSGLQWQMVPDSRVSVLNGFLYLECEPLAGRTFAHAARSFQHRLSDMWDGQRIDLEKVVTVRDGKRLKIMRKNVTGVEIVQQVRRRDNRWARPAITTLFERNGNLVALTYYGGSDPTGKVLKSLRLANDKTWKKPRACHLTDFHGAPNLGRFFTLSLPRGYTCDVWASKVEEEEKGLVARWRPHGEAACVPATLTLVRMNWGNGAILSDEVEDLRKAWKEAGYDVEETTAFEIAGRDGLSVTAKRQGEAESATRRWLVAWQMRAAVYGFVWESSSQDAEGVQKARAEAVRTFESLQAWTGKPRD